MSLLGLFKSRPTAPPSPETLEVPIFPLKTVLFPGGVLGLKIFEQRYLDMASAALREHSRFGICLILSGGETGAPAKHHAIGTLASIDQADMAQLGILLTTCRGDSRFRVLDTRVEANGLLRGKIQLLPESTVPVPPERQRLIPLLRKIVSDLGAERMPEPHAFNDAAWVGYRLTEVLPIQNLAKQKLLELDDPLVRLEILEKYLDQRKLLA